MNKLSEYKKTYISLNDLKEMYRVVEHKDAVNLVKKLENDGVISAVKSSELTPMYERIHTKYKVIKKEMENADELLRELNYTYHPSINVDYYRKNLDVYLNNRDALLKFNHYLINKSHLLNYKISINERSYEIFQYEKFIEKTPSFFKKIGWELEALNFYPTPEPFIYSVMSRNPGQKILIIENKDTFVTVTNLVNSGKKIFGHRISTVIYGEGRKIEQSLKNVPQDITLKYLLDPENEFYYWGDIDRVGFHIYHNLKNKIEWTNVRIFEVAYQKMLEASKLIELSDVKKDQKSDYKGGLNELKDKQLKLELEQLIENGKYIPQEILKFYDIEQEG